MSKLLILFVTAIVCVLFLTGMVEVKFHPQKYVDIPALTNNIISEKTTLEKGRAYTIAIKRKAELFIVQDKEKRLVLSLLYVKTDAQRLKDLIAKKVTAPALLPQAELLVSSIDLVRKNAEKAPVAVVASLKVESSKSFTIAQEALSGLQGQYEEFETIHGEFTRLTESLESQIGQLGLETNDADEESNNEKPANSVAGTTDKNEQPSPTAPDIQLKF